MSGMSAPSITGQDRNELNSLDTLGVATTGQFIVKIGADSYSYLTAITSMNGLSGPVQTFSIGIGGVSPAVNSSTTVHAITVPQLVVLTPDLSALDVSKTIFVADNNYQVVSIQLSWGVAGGAAAVFGLEKLTGTTAPGSGTALLNATTVDLTAAANTVVTPALTGTVSSLQLAAGDRLGIKLGGVLTGLVGCVPTIILKRI